jgi:hypothetical protein
MKKNTCILVAFFALIFSSCTTNEVTEVTEIVPYTYTKIFTITDRDWIKGSDDTGIYYYCEIAEPKLTDEVFDYGILQAYKFYKVDGRDTMTPLPYSDFIINGGYKWEEHFTVDFQPGYITFILKTDDHDDGSLPFYSSYEFLVRFLW